MNVFVNVFWPRQKRRLFFHVGPISEQTKPPPRSTSSGFKGEVLMALTMTDSQQCILSVGFKDKKGNPTGPPPGAQPPVWLVDNSELLSVAPAADGLSATVAAVGPLGSGKVSVKVSDAAGTMLASGSIDVTIVSGAPTLVSITPGTPTEQP